MKIWLIFVCIIIINDLVLFYLFVPLMNDSCIAAESVWYKEYLLISEDK